MLRRARLKRYTPLRKRRPGPPRRGRVHDKKFLDYIRTYPCAVPDCLNRDIEAAHVGLRGFGQKCNDREVIPLCGIEHHREGPESAHKLQKLFWAHHGIDRDRLINQLNLNYEGRKK